MREQCWRTRILPSMNPYHSIGQTVGAGMPYSPNLSLCTCRSLLTRKVSLPSLFCHTERGLVCQTPTLTVNWADFLQIGACYCHLIRLWGAKQASQCFSGAYLHAFLLPLTAHGHEVLFIVAQIAIEVKVFQFLLIFWTGRHETRRRRRPILELVSDSFWNDL